VSQAEHDAAKLTAPDGELQKHKQAVQSLSSHALQTRASLETLKQDQVALDDLREQLRQAQADFKTSTERTDGLKNDFDQLRSASSQLAADFSRMRDLSRETQARGGRKKAKLA
jgi:DNA repair exonuclease SbcCD ATPase subunit